MVLIEAEESFLVVSRTTEASHREFLRALLAYFRANNIPFYIGGARPDVVLTLGPLPLSERDELRRWWDWRMTARSGRD